MEQKLLPQWTETKSPITAEFVDAFCSLIYKIAKAKVLMDEFNNNARYANTDFE